MGGKEPVPSERTGDSEKRGNGDQSNRHSGHHAVGVMSRNPVMLVIANRYSCEAIPVLVKVSLVAKCPLFRLTMVSNYHVMIRITKFKGG